MNYLFIFVLLLAFLGVTGLYVGRPYRHSLGSLMNIVNFVTFPRPLIGSVL